MSNLAFEDKITRTPDFPKEGINFLDWSPALADAYSFKDMVYELDRICPVPKGGYAGIASRGYIIASSLAFKNCRGMVMIAKAGKLPPPVVAQSYDLEYGHATLEMKQAPMRGTEIVVCDDLIATGNSLKAAIEMAQRANYKVVGALVLMELTDLGGRKLIEDLGIPLFSAIKTSEK